MKLSRKRYQTVLENNAEGRKSYEIVAKTIQKCYEMAQELYDNTIKQTSRNH